MFSRMKKPQMPPYIEGTQGKYVRRASPPTIPSISSHVIQKKATASAASNGTLIGERSTSLAQPQQSPPKRTSFLHDIAPINDNCGTSATLLASERSDGAVVGRSTERRTSPAPLSSQSFCDTRSKEYQKKVLTSSHSTSNVETLAGDYSLSPDGGGVPKNKCVSVSLQNLPERHSDMPTQFGSEFFDTATSNTTVQEDQLPLPHNWTEEYTQDGVRYYVDHNTQTTHWIHPLVCENLPPNWTKVFDVNSGVIYYNERDGRSQVQHPGLSTTTAQSINRTESMLVAATKRVESAVGSLIIIQQEEVPEWLLLYSQADPSFDHMLRWELFDRPSLEQYDELMIKLYKQEIIDTVQRYERIRNMLNHELNKRI